MVAIVSGSSLGLGLSSMATLGQRGALGSLWQGRSGEQAYVNVATGNLVLQNRDELLLGRGLDVVSVRTYNSQGLLTDDNQDNWSVGAFGQRISVTGTLGQAGSTITRIDRDGAQATYAWDAARGLYLSTAGAGAFDTIAHDAGAAQLVWTDGDSGMTERYQAGGQGRLISTTDADGNIITLSYNAAGNVESLTDANGEVTWYDYTGNNLTQIRTVTADNVTTTRVRYAYDASDRLVSVTVDLSPADGSIADGGTYVTTYTYDSASKRVASVTQTDGTALSFTYEEVGGSYKVKTVTDALGAVTTFAYDDVAGATTVTDALGSSSVYLYDAEGQLTQVRQGVTATNPAGLSQVSYLYDAQGNVVRVTDGEGRQVSFEYDANGNLLKEVDSAGNTRTRTYGAANQLLTDTLYANAAVVDRGAFNTPAGLPETTRYVYAQGNDHRLRFVISAQGDVTEYLYDGWGQRTSAISYAATPYDTSSLGPEAVPTEAQLVAWRQGQDLTRSQRTDYGYDGRGALSSTTTYAQTGADGQGVAAGAATTQYVYDQQGLLLQKIEADNAAGVTSYVYDGLGRVISASGPSLDGTTQNITLTNYDDADGRTTVTLANGLSTLSAYDHAGRLVSVTQTGVGIGVLGTTTYAYDSEGRLLMTQDPTGARSWMLYDEAGRKVADIDATGAMTEYVYNANGLLRQTVAYATRIDTAVLVDEAGQPTTAWSAANTTTSVQALRPAGTDKDQKVWRFYDGANRLAWQVDALGYVTRTTYDGASRILSVTQLANPIDVSQLGSGANVELLADPATVGGVTLGALGGPVPLGTAVTLTASIAGTNPGGMVTFFSGDTVIGSAPVVNGQATLVTNELPVGANAIRAAYSGDTIRPAAISAVGTKLVNGATTSVGLSFSPSYGATYGQNVTLSTWLTTSQPPGLAPATGEVKFYSGATLLGTAAVINGQALLTLNDLPVGTSSIRAEYAGDALHAAATQTSSLSIAAAPTTTALQVAAAGGAGVQLSAMVSSGAGLPPPTGTVTFYNGDTAIGTAALVNGAASFHFTGAATAAPFRAVYGGDATHAASATATLYGTPLPSPSVTTLSASAASVTQGDAVTLTASVTGASPEGLVTFFAGTTFLGTAQVSNGMATLVTSAIPAGPAVALSAAYAGDGNNAGSVAAAGAVIQVAASADAVPPPTVEADAVRFDPWREAMVGFPTQVLAYPTNGYWGYDYPGTYSVFDGQTLIASFMNPTGDMVYLPPLAAGTHNLTVIYSGDADRSAGSTTLQLVVEPAASELTLASSGQQAAAGAPLTLRATVSPDGWWSNFYSEQGGFSGPPSTGTVTFYSDGVAIGTADVVDGVATLTTSGLPLGTSSITASYSGDANYQSAAVPDYWPLTQQVTANPVTTYTAASAAPSAPVYGTPVVLTARPTGQGNPQSGTVSFYEGAVLLGTANLVNGTATLTLNSLEVGSHSIQTVYSGDANNAASTGYAYFTVQKAPAPLTSQTPPTIDEHGTLSVQVDGVQPGPGGLVSFYIGTRLLGTAQVVNGVATLSGVPLPAGTFTITAAYTGDAHHLDSEVSFIQTIQGDPSTLIVAELDNAQDRTTVRLYDRDGQLQGVLDAEGYLTEYTYDAAGRLARTLQYANRAANFADEATRTAAVAVARASYNLAGLRPSTNGADISTYNFYDAQDRLVGQVDGEGYLTETVYDLRGNVAQTRRYANKAVNPGAAGATLASIRPSLNAAQDQTVTQIWSAANLLISRTNAEGTVTQYAYDSVGHLVKAVVAAGTGEARTSRFMYDLQGRLTGELDGRGTLAVGASTDLGQWQANGTTHTYDAAGRRTSTTDANGQRTLFFYDGAGRLAYTVNALGEATENRYSAHGQLTEQIVYGSRINVAALAALTPGELDTSAIAAQLAAMADAAKDTRVQHDYTAVGTEASTTDALGQVTDYSYNAFREAIASTYALASGQVVTDTAGYDRRGLRTVTTRDASALALAERATYDAFGRVVEQYDGNNNRTRFAYDRLGRVVTTIDPLGGYRYATYDAFDRVLTQRDALGYTTTYSYSTANRSVTVTTPEGVAVTTVRTRHGQTQSVADGRGNTTTYTYDASGNLVQTSQPLGVTTTAEYDKTNLLIKTTDARGIETVYAYDAARRLATRTLDPAGLNLVTTYAYDAKGQGVAVTDARGVVTTTDFDLAGQAIRQTVDPTGLNLQTVYTYDATGQVLTVTDPNGHLTRYTYDGAGRRVRQQVDPDGLNLTTAYEYDANDNVTRVIDANGNATRYAYDANDQRVFSVDAMGGVARTEYDQEGRIVRTTAYATPLAAADLAALGDAPGVAAIQAKVAANAAADVTQARRYDRDGRLRFTVDGTGAVVEYKYDKNNNVIETRAYANRISLAVWNLAVDPPVVADASRDERVRTVYDALDRAAWQVDGAGGVTGYAYDANGNVIDQRAYANALAGGAFASWNGTSAPPVAADASRDQRVRTVYDNANRAVWSVDALGGVSSAAYDAVGNVIDRRSYATALDAASLAAWDGATPPPAVADDARDAHVRQVFDAASRLTWSVDGTGAVTRLAYDANGNVIRRQQYAGAIAPGADPWTAVASDDDRAVDYLYDAAGRMAYQLRWTNSSDLMSGVGPMREVTSYAYDGVGRLVRQTQHAWPLMSYVGGDIDAVFGNLSVAPGLDRSSFMVYDAAGRLAWSVDGVGAVTQNRYDGTGTLTGTIQYANPVDVLDWSGVANGYDIPPLDAPQLQGMLLPDASRDRVTAMAHDTAGRTTFTVDALGGVSRTVYDAFGNVTLQAGYANRIAAPTDASVYTDAGLRASIVADASADRVQRLAWDQAGRQVFSVDALGAAVETSYDGLGQAVQTRRYARAIGTDGLSPTASVADIRARVVADAASDRIDRHAYDAAGREVYGVDAYGYVTASTYDALGQRTGTTLHALAIPAATANSASAIGAAIVADAADRTTTHAYDAAGRVLATTDALGFTESWSYDALGNKSAYTNANGATWTYGYDRTGRMLWESSPAVEITDVWPDGQGRLQTQTYTGSVVTQMVYDAFGNLRQRIEQQAHADQRITEYAYDQLGRQVMVIYPATQVDTGQDPSSGQRTDTWQSKVVATHYDALGNAVVNDEFARDQATGAYVYDDRRLTYKTYDRLGRVAYEVDAEGHVTGYERNTFGDATVLTRHGQAIALPAQPQWPQDPVAPTTAQVGAATASLDHGADRVLHTTFDRLGRAIEVKEPQAFVYDSSLGVGNAGSTQGKTTRNTYDTFGDLVQVARLKGAGTWVLDTRYFDRRGQQVASVDALGHLTARNYDAAGNLVEHVEYANALAGWAGTGSLAGWSGLVNAAAGTAPAPGAPAPEDRRTSYGYDLLNRKTSETRVDVEFSTASNGTSQRGNLTTTYGYDAVGNLTRTTAPLGASTYSWYDALGRVVAVAGPEVYDVGLEIGRTPLTVYRHDAYGNVVATTEYVNGAAWDGVPLPWAAAPNPMPETVAVPNPEIATLAGLGYVQETSPGYISADAFPGSKPIYRLYSNNPLVPVHFYTDSAAERDALVATGIWRSEGVAGHLAAAQAPGTVPLYKIQIASAWSWSGLSAYYVYTSDETERQQLLSQPGAVDWGAMGYVATQPGEAMHTQLARYYNPATSDHFYTPATIDLPPDPERDADLYASTDRTTLAMYDANGNVVQSTDAMGVQHLSSYTVHGQLAREWQSVTGNDGGTSTGTSVLWRAYDYDRLGQQTHVYEPGTATDNASFVGGAATAPGVYSARPGASVQQGSFGPYPDSEPGTPDPGGEPPAQTYGKLTLGNLVNLLAGAGAFQVEFDYLTPDYEVTTPGDENNPPTTTSGHGSYTHVSPLQPASAAGMPVDFVPAHPLGSVQQIRIYSVAAGGARTLVWSGSVEQADGQTTLDLGNNAGAAPVDTALAYNAFGELVGRSVNGQAVEYFDYDNAGRLWRTNAGDGVDRVALYDALGNQTAQIGSAGAGRADMNLRHVGDAAQVAGFKDVRRTDTTYDLLGRVVSQAGPERLETQGGAGVRTDALAGGIASRASHDGQGWSGINTVNLSWNMTSGLGSGDVLVRVIYASIDENGNPGPERVVTRIFNATQAQGGASISWNTNDAQQQDRLGSITRIEVHKKDVNANWVQLASQGFGDVGQALLVDAPDNPQSTTVVQYRVAGSGGTWAQLPAVHFGEQLRADLGGLPLGTYEYQAVTTTVGQAPVTAAAGTFSITPKPLAGFTVDGVDPGSQTLQWQGPGAGDSQVIRVRTGGGAWVQLPIVRDGGDYSRVDLSGLGAGTYEYEILWTRPGESGPYAHASGQFTKVAGVPGTPEVPPSGLPHIGGIALETRTETQTLGTDESGNPITATRQVTVMKLPPPPAGQVSALLLHIKGDGAPLVPMIITARADGWWEFNLTDSGWMPFVGVYEYAYGYSPGLGQPAVAHAIGDLGKGLASPGPGYTFSLADTTPPYVPGTPATPGTPAQYAWSATDAGPYAISQDPLLGGRAISLAAGLNGLNAWQRPVVNQNVDRWGNVVAISDPRSAGWVTTYRYNANDQIVEQRQPDADGNAGAASPVTRLYYDAMGRQVAVRDANGHVNGQAWDAGGHLVRELHADGGVISHAYDAFGNRTLSIDALGHGTWYTHDKLDRLVKTTRAAVDIWGWPTPQLPLAPSALIGHGQTVETQRFDEAGRLRSQTNGAGETIRYEYDLRGNLVKTTLPMGQETVAGYDALNRKTIEMDANGAVAAWRYDAFGRLAGHTDLGGAEYSYTYDNARQLVAQSNTRGQNQAYGYDAAGQLTGIADIAIGQTTSYRYDLSGRRIRETTVQGGVVYQDNHIAYDALGRMRWVGDSRVTLTIDYDAVGNRTRIATHVNDADAGAQPDTERFYAYDAMNRQVLVDSATADGSVLGDDGHLLTYDLNGNRTSDTRDGPHLAQVNGQWVAVGGQSTETYGYDAQGRLVSTVRDGVLVDARGYDQAGRLINSSPGGLPEGYAAAHSQAQGVTGLDPLAWRQSRYDANGRVVWQTALTFLNPLTTPGGQSYTGTAYEYDAAGNVTASTQADVGGGALTRTVNTIERAEGYRQAMSQTVSAVVAGGGGGASLGGVGYAHDVNGHLTHVGDAGDMSVTRSHFFVNDVNGTALYGYYGDPANPQQGQRQLVVNGEVLGRYGWVPDERYAGLDFPVPGFTPFKQTAEFGFGYQPINGNYPSGSPGSYAVGEGDTLQGIAKGAYGDSSLWYLIADANGLTGNADLRVGQVLTIPVHVSSANNSGSFQPYDPSRIIQDNGPTMMALPSDQGGGCGGVGQVIVAVVAVVVAAFTQQWYLVNVSGISGGIAGAVSAGAYGSLAVSGAVAGAAGSVASQGVGMAIGTQDSFSWEGVAMGAIGGAVGGALAGSGVLPNTGSTFANAAIRGAVGNTITQGIAVATGLQSKFDWKGVAASALGAGVGQGLNAAMGYYPGQPGVQFDLGRSLVSGLGGAIVANVARGGKISAANIAADAFGNALGESLAGAMGQKSNTAVADADPLGDFIKQNGWASTASSYDELQAAKPGQRRSAATSSSASTSVSRPVDDTNPFRLAAGVQRVVDDGDGTVYDIDANNNVKVVIDGAPAPAAGPGQRIQLNPYQLTPGASRVVDGSGNVYDVLQDGTVRSVIDGSSQTKSESAWRTVIRPDGFDYGYVQTEADGIDINKVRTTPGAVRTSDDFGNVQDVLPNGKTRMIVSVDSPLPISQQLIINQSLQNSLTNMQDRGAEIRSWNNETAKMAFYNAFGTTETEARSVVLQRIEGNIASNQSIDISNFQYASRNANPGWTDADYNGIGAYVRRNDPSNTIYVGPSLGRGDIAQVLTHETSHWNGTGPVIPGSNPRITGTVDGYVDPKTGRIAVDATGKEIVTYGVADVRSLAPNVALYHADTFGFYVSDLIRPRTPSYGDYIGAQGNGAKR